MFAQLFLNPQLTMIFTSLYTIFNLWTGDVQQILQACILFHEVEFKTLLAM